MPCWPSSLPVILELGRQKQGVKRTNWFWGEHLVQQETPSWEISDWEKHLASTPGLHITGTPQHTHMHLYTYEHILINAQGKVSFSSWFEEMRFIIIQEACKLTGSLLPSRSVLFYTSPWGGTTHIQGGSLLHLNFPETLSKIHPKVWPIGNSKSSQTDKEY